LCGGSQRGRNNHAKGVPRKVRELRGPPNTDRGTVSGVPRGDCHSVKKKGGGRRLDREKRVKESEDNKRETPDKEHQQMALPFRMFGAEEEGRRLVASCKKQQSSGTRREKEKED